jgi:hypothetical protein
MLTDDGSGLARAEKVASGGQVVLMQFGPDLASRLVLLVGPVVLTILAVALSIRAPVTCGGVVFFWLIGGWYCWRSGRRTEIVLTDQGLRVVTALRSFETSWASVTDAGWSRGHFVLETGDGTHFRIPQYTTTPIIRAIPSLTASRHRLEKGVADARNSFDATKVRDRFNLVPRRNWLMPAPKTILLLIALSTAAELGSLAIR